MSGCVGHELLEVPDTPDRLTMQTAGCLRWAVGAKRSVSARFRERRENGNLSIEQEGSKCGDNYLVSSVPDSPYHLALQNSGSLSTAVGGKRPRSVFKERRENGNLSIEQEATKCGNNYLVSSVADCPDHLALKNSGSLSTAVGGKRPRSVFKERREKEISSSREQKRTKRGMTNSVCSSDSPCFLGMTSCRRQLSNEQEETKCGNTHLVSSVPDSPDCLALQNGGSLSRDVGGRRPRSVFKERRENGISSSREQERTKRGMATSVSSSDSPCLFDMTSCGRQLRLSKKGAFAQDQDHVHSGSPVMETRNKMSAEDKSLPKNAELCHGTRGEVKTNIKESISGHAILTPKWNRRKMLVRNGRISPNYASTDANMSNRGVKRVQVAGDNLKGSVINDVSAEANSLINSKHVLQPSGSCLPCSDQLDNRRKGKEIVSGDMNERCQESSVQLTPSRKRMRGNLSSSEEAIRLPRCLNSTAHGRHGSSSMVTEARSQEPRNGFLLNRLSGNESEENIQLEYGTLPHSRIHQNEGQSSRPDKLSSRSSPLSLVVDEENSSDTSTPEVIFLRSSRQLRKNIPSTSIACNAQASSSNAVEVDNYSPIDVDSLESPLTNIVNVDASNKVPDARTRQIEQDEMLAMQLQEEFAGEIPEERLQEDDPILHSTVQRERREHMFASDSGSLFPGLRASFGIGARREPARSLRIHPARASPLSSLSSAHSRTIPVYGRVSGSGLMGRSRGRSVHDRTFRFPRNMNSEMRVDFLEALEQIVESSNLTHQLISGVQRDFNEDDYEMLLALDNNNDNHRGASQQRIERLPTSIVQTDVSDERCSICLENPKVGDVIRHLLCMHKFHKECIDHWLQIQACCPVCKHSV